MKKLILTIILILFMNNYLLAHSGRTDSNGCHNNKTGKYHCHTKKVSNNEFRLKLHDKYVVFFNPKIDIWIIPTNNVSSEKIRNNLPVFLDEKHLFICF